MAAEACGWATGAGFFRTKNIASNDASNVATLIIRSSLNFMATLRRSARGTRAHRHGTWPRKRSRDDQSDRQSNVPIVWRGHSCPPLLTLILNCCPAGLYVFGVTAKTNQSQKRRTGVSAPHNRLISTFYPAAHSPAVGLP